MSGPLFHYSVWFDLRTNTYEVVRWHEGVPQIVQSNIRTKDKADKAKTDWQRRESRRRTTDDETH